MDQNVCLNMVKNNQLCAIAQPFEVLCYSIDANTSCSSTKQDLTVKQAYCVSFCFVLCNEPKF